MKQHLVALGFLALVASAFAGCSAKNNATDNPANALCDSSKCAPGNFCISDGKETKCRLVCKLNPDGTGGNLTCPLNYHCVDGENPYYAQDKTQYQKGSSGLWGASCNPTQGFDNNPACDSNQNFWCYAVAPTDGAAFCTQFDCTDDTDCKGNYYCAKINSAPNATQTARTVGQTRTACLPRTYCSPCATDIDCPFDQGRRQHCITDNAGGKLCAPECSADSQCNTEALCTHSDDANTNVCFPRAGACVGDGSICSPCRSDADCTSGGACVFSSYNTEHFCAIPSGVPCHLDATSHLVAQCPSLTNLPNARVSCTIKGTNDWPDIPDSFCYGNVLFGSGQDQARVPGCYTPAR